MIKQIEICCGSFDDCLQAYHGGAKRVELNSALHMGGLTPSVGSLRLTKLHTDLQVIVMVRPRGAGFCYGEADYACMIEDTKIMLDQGADGIAFGCLDEAGNIHQAQTRELVQHIHSCGKIAVFHRAFDCIKDPFTAMKTLIEVGVDRVLTSGLQPKAMDGQAIIKELQERYGTQIEIIAGSGLHAGNASELMEYTGITQVHSSCKDWMRDCTTSLSNVSYAYGEEEHSDDYDVVSEKKVRDLVQSIV